MFRVSAQPTFDIGGLKINLDDELSATTSALTEVRLSDGRHVVADGTRLRFLDATGRQEHVVGRRGQGPGEFQAIAALCITHGDTIIVNDPGNSRITVFDKQGNEVREVPVGRTFLLPSGCLDDGTFIASETVRPAGAPPARRLVHLQLDGSVIGTVGEFWYGETGLFAIARPVFAAHGQQVYSGDPRTSEVRTYSPNGRLVGIIRFSDPIERLSARERDALSPRTAPGNADKATLDRFKERLRSEPRPTAWPSYSLMMVDPDGRLWLQDFQRDVNAATPVVWTAFDAMGKLLGRFSMPARRNAGDPYVIGFTSGGVLIRHNDEDGAPHLTTYALTPVNGARQ